jgi:hypothetical protein
VISLILGGIPFAYCIFDCFVGEESTVDIANCNNIFVTLNFDFLYLARELLLRRHFESDDSVRAAYFISAIQSCFMDDLLEPSFVKSSSSRR